MPYAGYQPAHEVFLGRLAEVNWDTKTYVAVATSHLPIYSSTLELMDEDLNIIKSFPVNAILMDCAVSSKGDVMGVGYGPVLSHNTFYWRPYSEYAVVGQYTFIVRNAIKCLNGSVTPYQPVGDSQRYTSTAANRDGSFFAGYVYGGAGFFWTPWWTAIVPDAFPFFKLINWHQHMEKIGVKGGGGWITAPPYGSMPSVQGQSLDNKTYDWGKCAADGEGSLYAGSTQGVIKFSPTGGMVWEKKLLGMFAPSSICTDNQNNVYFGHYARLARNFSKGESRVYKIHNNGSIMWMKAITNYHGFGVPQVAVDSQRSVYICDGRNIIKTPEPKSKATAWTIPAGFGPHWGTFAVGMGAHKKSLFLAVRSFSGGIGPGSGTVTKYDRDTGKLLGSRSFGRDIVGLGVTQAWGPRTPPKPPPRR